MGITKNFRQNIATLEFNDLLHISHLLNLFEEVVAERQLLICRAISAFPGLDRLDGQKPQFLGYLFRRREGLLCIRLHRQLQELLQEETHSSHTQQLQK